MASNPEPGTLNLIPHVVMMGWPGPSYKNPKHSGEVSFNMYVMVDDVERHYQRAKKAGAVIIEKLATTRFGSQRYGASDPEGHSWYFAEPGEKTREVPRSLLSPRPRT